MDKILTWSTAREHRLSEYSAGPRPVRSLDTPMGLDNLTVRELKQVIVGNRLLGVALVLIFHCLMTGVFALLEHPTKPSKPSPSIWKLPILQLLLGHPDVKLITVRQGLFGAKSSKPTDLLMVKPPRDYATISLNVVQAPNTRWWCFNRIVFQQHFAQSLAQTRANGRERFAAGVTKQPLQPVITGSEGKQLSPGFDQHIARQGQWSSSQHCREQILRIYLGKLKIFCDPSEHK